MPWSSVEKGTRGAYDFSSWGLGQTTLEERGLGSLIILCYGNDLYNLQTFRGSAPPEQWDGYAAYAAASARYFQRPPGDLRVVERA